MTPFDFSVAPNTTRQIDAQGGYLYYYSGSAGGADPTLAVKGRRSGYRAQLLPGQGLRLPPGVIEETWLLSVGATQGGTVLGRVVIGDGEIQDNRSTGIVEVVDGGKARTLGGSAFSSGAASSTTVAANNCALQLFNLAASGKNLIVEQVTGVSNYGNGKTMFQLLLTTAGTQMTGASGFAKSKLGGGADSTIAQLRSQENFIPTGHSPVGFFVDTAGNLVPREPIVVPPNYGLALIDVMLTGAANVHTMWGTFEHYEQAVGT